MRERSDDLRARMQRVTSRPAAKPAAGRARAAKRPTAKRGTAPRAGVHELPVHEVPVQEVHDVPVREVPVRDAHVRRSRLTTLIAWATWEMTDVARQRVEWMRELVSGETSGTPRQRR